ncbi:ABC transporter substrate-binding protein [Rhizobium sp. RU36D]|uniref:ABC transporter substrate-binding protein n=1 Tax=Rhizobium sp. RU36D TaxID=1907415 RepID=UPI0009D8A343|nr:ABC transporter substrate-binding protein [Rhizobium sp. RU36D]SMC75760.1 NitT/TauT family transport system substrate-binding protein [Rhizobium sp. RU36D]
MKLIRRLTAALVGLCLTVASAEAATKLAIGYTMNSEAAPIYVAKMAGIFDKHGLDVELVPIAVNSTLPAALISDSIQLGTISPTVFIQAVQNGLELRGVSGMTVTAQNGSRVGVMAREGSGITSLADLKGKTLGVPGIAAVLDIMARRLIIEAGIDVNAITYTETPFPVQADVLKNGTVDAVVTVDPFLSRIERAGIGKPIANLLEGIPDGQLAQFFAASSSWAEANPEAIKAFRAAMDEAIQMTLTQPDYAREAIGNFVKLPPEVLKTVALPTPDAKLTAEQLEWWAQVMQKQDLISDEFSAGDLILQR